MSLCRLLKKKKKKKLYPLNNLKDFTLYLPGVRYFDRALGKVKYLFSNADFPSLCFFSFPFSFSFYCFLFKSP